MLVCGKNNDNNWEICSVICCFFNSGAFLLHVVISRSRIDWCVSVVKLLKKEILLSGKMTIFAHGYMIYNFKSKGN